MAKFVTFLKESREELKKVVWPGKEEVLNSTIVVMGAVIVISLFLYSIDVVFETLFNTAIRLKTGGG